MWSSTGRPRYTRYAPPDALGWFFVAGLLLGLAIATGHLVVCVLGGILAGLFATAGTLRWMRWI